MRELKFRIWNGSCFVAIPDTYIKTSDGSLWDYDEDYGGDTVLSHKKLWSADGKIQQYTGLKDKNGVEIYEGDIVKAFTCNDDTEFYAPVKFCPHHGYYLDSAIERHDRILYDGGVSVGPKCEVIGNIYSNPELLTECYLLQNS